MSVTHTWRLVEGDDAGEFRRHLLVIDDEHLHQLALVHAFLRQLIRHLRLQSVTVGNGGVDLRFLVVKISLLSLHQSVFISELILQARDLVVLGEDIALCIECFHLLRRQILHQLVTLDLVQTKKQEKDYQKAQVNTAMAESLTLQTQMADELAGKGFDKGELMKMFVVYNQQMSTKLSGIIPSYQPPDKSDMQDK